MKPTAERKTHSSLTPGKLRSSARSISSVWQERVGQCCTVIATCIEEQRTPLGMAQIGQDGLVAMGPWGRQWTRRHVGEISELGMSIRPRLTRSTNGSRGPAGLSQGRWLMLAVGFERRLPGPTGTGKVSVRSRGGRKCIDSRCRCRTSSFGAPMASLASGGNWLPSALRRNVVARLVEPPNLHEHLRVR